MRNTVNIDYTNQVPISTQPLPTKMGIGAQANAILVRRETNNNFLTNY